jgi:multidrug efflux pump subunit AcrB/ABC-type multidrug transport system ATPase subunit
LKLETWKLELKPINQYTNKPISQNTNDQFHQKKNTMNFIIKRKVLISMLFIGLSMLGYISYKQLQVELYPNTTVPFLFVQIYTGLEVDPRYMENQAIIPLEGAIGTLEGVSKIQSNAGQQQGSIRVSYQKSTNLKYAYLKLVEKVDEIKKTIPSEFQVQVFKFDIEQLTNMFMSLQVRGGGGLNRVRNIADKEILNKIRNIDGIANAEVFGGREKSIEIVLKQDVCNSYGISPADVRSALTSNTRSRNFVGKVNQNSQSVFINVISEFKEIEEIYELIVKPQGNIRLKDIAQINFGFKIEDSYSRVNGKDAVTIQLTHDSQSNIINLSNQVKDFIEKLNKELKSKDIEIVVQANSAQTMEDNIDLIINLALTGGLLAIFVLWVFLKNIRLVVAIALAIPISVYTAFNFFYAYGISINSLTLMGMALAIGMLLDNSVVVLENIYRLASQKMNPDQAVIKGTKEVMRSIIASTLTTVMVFLPFAFSENFLIGLMGKHIGVSIISMLLVSLLVALLLVPMLTHVFLRKGGHIQSLHFEKISLHNRMVQVYMVMLKSCMRGPARTIIGALGIFFIILLISVGYSVVSGEEVESKELALYITMPGGSTLETTDLLVADAEKRLENLVEKKDIVSQVYESEAVLTITLVDNYKKLRNYPVPKIKKEIIDRLSALKQANFSWDQPSEGQRFGTGGFEPDEDFEQLLGIGVQKEKVIIKGKDFEQMINLANDVKYYLTQISGIEKIDIRIPDKRPELLLDFDKNLMAFYDIPLSSVLSELNSFPKEFSSGVVFKQGTDEYQIMIKTDSESQQKERNANELKRLLVRGTSGARFDLGQISSFNFTEGMPSIRRVNQEKQLVVEYQFISEVNDDTDLLAASRAQVDDLVAGINFPSGMSYEIVHEDQSLGEFGFLLLAAFVLIYMILASVFESFVKPAIMLFSIPMAAIGSLIALLLTGNSIMNANVLTGFVILLGIVVNNGIILMDYATVLQKRGYTETRSLMMAGLARVRPILITAITTIVALIPLAMGKAEYVTRIGVPFAITVIGGLATSTILTLVFIPTFNSGLQSAMRWMRVQKPQIKLIQALCWILGTWLIFTHIDSRIWQIINFTVLLIAVPALIFFIQNSLRKANEKLIAPDSPIHISIRNLVKVYGRDTKFVREWKSGIKIRERLKLINVSLSQNKTQDILWQLPVLFYALYFIYFHIEGGFWFFVLPILFYLLGLYILPFIFQNLTGIKARKGGIKWLKLLFRVVYKTFFWIYPALAMVLFYIRFGLPGLAIPAAILWYFAILVKFTSDKLYKEKTDVNRLKGRFKGIRKAFYRLVLVIPFIGRKKIPFKALSSISLDIHQGMFGLLGPNGAGKSTLMRIICGILEQSYGQITFNGIDVAKKREELQGLIGYLPQEFGMYENMTAAEFLNYMAILKKIYNNRQREERVDYVLNAVHMHEYKSEKIGSFSGGMKQRIGIAQILLHLPRILVVDEPTAGLDPRERIRFRNLLVELSKERIVLFSTHIIEDVASSCNRVAVMKEGKLKYIGSPVDMASIAGGRVWVLTIEAERFEEIKHSLVIIHHIREGEKIRIRCIADTEPMPGAIQTRANLEDAYLCLLNQNN